MKKNTTATPHDAVFKQFLRHPGAARDFLELVQKHIRRRELTELAERVGSLVVTGYANDRQLRALVNYLVRAGRTPRLGHFLREVARYIPDKKERLMTLAQRLIAAGRRKGRSSGLQEGREEGLAEGLEEGRREEALRIARIMLADGIDRNTVFRVTGISAEDLTVLPH